MTIWTDIPLFLQYTRDWTSLFLILLHFLMFSTGWCFRGSTFYNEEQVLLTNNQYTELRQHQENFKKVSDPWNSILVSSKDWPHPPFFEQMLIEQISCIRFCTKKQVIWMRWVPSPGLPPPELVGIHHTTEAARALEWDTHGFETWFCHLLLTVCPCLVT